MPHSRETGPERALPPQARAGALAGAIALALGACGGAGEADPAAPEAAAPAAPAIPPTANVAATAEAAGAGTIRLVDEAAQRGLKQVNSSGTPEKDYVLEANGAGVAVLDLAGDGDLDLVFAQGLASLERLVQGPGADLEVFSNDGTGHFERAPGPGLSGWWTGLAAGDVDGDGLADLVAGGFGRLVLLAQGADGTFAPAAEILEPDERWIPGGELSAGAPPWITSLALFDAEGDGDLDLFAGLYLEFDPRHPPRGALGEGPLAVPCRWRGHEVFCGPHGLVPQADRLYLWESQAEGGGRFVDSSERLDGLVPAYTLAVATLDVEGDGDTDLYVAVDSMPNHLWINEGGRFVDVGWSAGVAVSSDGAPQAGMGVAVGDVDRNGSLDLAVTNFSGETTQLYLGTSRGFDVGTHRYGLQRETRELLSWSAHLVDLDADGWLELFTTNGHVYPQADLADTGTRYGQPAMLWRLGPEARAARVAPDGEDSLLFSALGARGAAVGDFDLDGAVDLVLARIDGPAALGMNRTEGAGARLTVRLVDSTLADAIGARALLAVTDGAGGERLAVAEVRTAEGYQSASSPWLYFGLGTAERFERIEVRWPSGASETIPAGPAGRMITVREGQGIVAEQSFR